MTKKLSRLEAFQELMLKLSVLEQKIDKVLEIEGRLKVVEAYIDQKLTEKYHGVKLDGFAQDGHVVTENIRCVFETLSPEDRMKPMSVSCPCPKCTPYAFSSGSVTSNQNNQVLLNVPSVQVDLEPEIKSSLNKASWELYMEKV